MFKKRTFIVLAMLLLIVSLAFGFGYFKYKDIVSKPLKDGETFVNVETTAFSEILNSNDSFKSKVYIKIYNKLNSVKITAKKGIYEFPQDITLEELLDCLEKGKYNTSIVRFTIPEGYTLEQIANKLEGEGVVAKTEFIEACDKYEFDGIEIKSNDIRHRLEGFLFPDTYFLEKDMKADRVIEILLGNFRKVIRNIEKERGIDIKDEDIFEIVTKASVIEREVKLKEEKFLVSSVIDNRIKKGMKLQIDATVLYALGEHKDRVLYEDLKYKSPYNTYYITGLPVGPISNPGKDSIEAAIFPDTTEYLFYMTKDGKNHKFFKDYNLFLEYKNEK